MVKDKVTVITRDNTGTEKTEKSVDKCKLAKLPKGKLLTVQQEIIKKQKKEGRLV